MAGQLVKNLYETAFQPAVTEPTSYSVFKIMVVVDRMDGRRGLPQVRRMQRSDFDGTFEIITCMRATKTMSWHAANWKILALGLGHQP